MRPAHVNNRVKLRPGSSQGTVGKIGKGLIGLSLKSKQFKLQDIVNNMALGGGNGQIELSLARFVGILNPEGLNHNQPSQRKAHHHRHHVYPFISGSLQLIKNFRPVQR
jgi:hypothetical protein